MQTRVPLPLSTNIPLPSGLAATYAVFASSYTRLNVCVQRPQTHIRIHLSSLVIASVVLAHDLLNSIPVLTFPVLTISWPKSVNGI
jgi:hypothetical protein